ncbi:MAG: 3-phosphoshikimate 1-carboxyvinyltransferase [Methanomicrobiales archaeon]|nr:3-phosphoshikimate 1-carboxyvinyltransferase [Methanomicrobiales archaeon]
MRIQLPRAKEVQATFAAPPSKSFTHRAYIAGALAEGRSVISNALLADDTAVTRNILTEWGIPIQGSGGLVEIEGKGGTFCCEKGKRIDVHDSGTSIRFFTTLALLCTVPVVLEGSRRMHERPIGSLIDAIRRIGAECTYLGKEGFPPLRISGTLQGGNIEISGKESSQFISSILLASPYAQEDITLTCPEIPVSQAYIDITLRVMQDFGARYKRNGYTSYTVQSGAHYTGTNYMVEGDYSSAAYFMAIAAICGGSVTVTGLNPSTPQGDHLFLEALSAMGCKIHWKEEGLNISREGDLSGITINMSSSPDSVQTLCMIAACARSPTTITGVHHLRLKESDRLQSTADVLRTLGADVRLGKEHITILPGPLHSGVVDPKNDHRTVMSAAVLGLGIGGVTILQAECVNKSFPEFWMRLREAGLL